MNWNTIVVAGNELWQVGALFGVVLAALVAAKLGKMTLLQAAERLERHRRLLAATALRALAKAVTLLAVALAFPVGSAFLVMTPPVAAIVGSIKNVLASLAMGFVMFHLVDVVFIWLKERAKASGSSMDGMLVPIVRTSLRVTVIVLTILQVAQSLTGTTFTSILAGLGVGSLAVALAAQDTVKHFFGSLMLLADKPFQVGDRITVDATDGTVEEVGFRSTRIRTLEGHLVSIPNGDLANKTIINIARRPSIRHRSVFSLTYDTPPAKVARAVAILKELLDNHEGMKPDFPPRIVFQEFGAASLNVLVMFWYHPAVYWDYMAFLEKLNLEILGRFNAEGIDFAFPTQTLYLAGDAKRPLLLPPVPDPTA